jgi:polyphosphate kinase
LEHSRIWRFDNAHKPEVFVASADWMPRSFHRRIEVGFPIEDGTLKHRLIDEITSLPLKDNVKARVLNPDGTYWIPPRPKGIPAHRSQAEFISLARQASSQGRRDRSRDAGVTKVSGPGKLIPGKRPKKA